MFIDNDLLKLSQEGCYQLGYKHDRDDEFLVSRFFAETDKVSDYWIITNITSLAKNKEPSKPHRFNEEDMQRYFVPSLDEDCFGKKYLFAETMLMSDEQLKAQHANWVIKRDTDFERIQPFTDAFNIWKYLSGQLGKEIEERAKSLGINSKAIRRPMNRYISLGCHINGLLPIAYSNVGKGLRRYKVKPGRKTTADGLPVISQTRMMLANDEARVKQICLANRVPKVDGQFVIKRIYNLFLQEFCSEHAVKNVNGKSIPYLKLRKENSITYDQFYYIFKKLFTGQQYEQLKIGPLPFERNRRDKAGSARSGIYRAAQICEIDSTPLPIYLAYPLDKKNRLSAGKVYLCIVICVVTHFVVGYSLSFAPPKWENVMEALLNCALDKQAYAKQYGLDYDKDDWPSQIISEGIRIDNGIENPDEILAKITEARVGINNVYICPPGRPDCKGTVENVLDILQKFLANVIGTVDKNRDASHQHASQKAILQLDDIHRLLIEAIRIHNNFACRPNLLSTEMAMDDVGFTPRAIWLYLINSKLCKRPLLSQKEIPRYFWTMLKKYTVSVGPEEIRFKKRGYSSEWAEKEGWFSKAASSGSFKVEVVLFGGAINHLYHKDSNGELQRLSLKREYAQFNDMTLLQATVHQRKLDEEIYENEWAQKEAMINFNVTVQDSVDNAQAFYKDAPPNHQRTMQKNINERNAIMREQEQQDRAKNALKILDCEDLSYSFSVPNPVSQDDDLEDIS